MRARLFHKRHLERLEFKTASDRKEQPINPGTFVCLQGNDVITARVSDHHPVIHNGVLFWNIMMQGKMRVGKDNCSYNNGFGMIETDKHYMSRLVTVASVIAEMIEHNPGIETIGLCEGPISFSHVNVLYQSLKRFACMQRFLTKDTFYKPNLDAYPNWGLLMLADNQYSVSEISFDFVLPASIFDKVANRFQLWQFTREGTESYFGLAHLPFGGDESVTDKTKLSQSGNVYCDLINHVMAQYSNKHFILCADFNFNPYLIKQWQDRALDKITHNNSILLTVEENKSSIREVTVDGILLSVKEKQRHCISQLDSRLSANLTHEHCLFKSFFYNDLERNRHENSRMQHEYDKRFGLISLSL